MRPSPIVLGLAMLFCATGNAYAYLDPGTGSIILQAMVAAFASFFFVVKMYWYRLKSLFGMSSAGNDDSDAEAGPAQ